MLIADTIFLTGPKWLKELLACPLKDLLPGKLRVWHALLAILLVAVLLKGRFPGGRPFDDEQPAPSPIADIDVPEEMLASLRTKFDSSARPVVAPAVLHLARACDAVYASGDTSVPRLFFDLEFDRVVPIESGSDFATVGIKDLIAVVVFRGTDEIKDWYTNLSVRWQDVEHGQLHSGFWYAYQSLRETIVRELDAQELEYIWICGHSLGGAMALCCAYDLESTTDLPLSGVVTFGQPKLANTALARHINTALSGKYLAVVADEDPVADTVPLCRFCGDSVWFDGESIRYDSSRVAALSTNPQTYGAAPPETEGEPFFQDVMSEEELERNQALLREQDAPLPQTPDGPIVYRSSLPFFRDHNMSNYITKLRDYFGSESSTSVR